MSSVSSDWQATVLFTVEKVNACEAAWKWNFELVSRRRTAPTIQLSVSGIICLWNPVCILGKIQFDWWMLVIIHHSATNFGREGSLIISLHIRYSWGGGEKDGCQEEGNFPVSGLISFEGSQLEHLLGKWRRKILAGCKEKLSVNFSYGFCKDVCLLWDILNDIQWFYLAQGRGMMTF